MIEWNLIQRNIHFFKNILKNHSSKFRLTMPAILNAYKLLLLFPAGSPTGVTSPKQRKPTATTRNASVHAWWHNALSAPFRLMMIIIMFKMNSFSFSPSQSHRTRGIISFYLQNICMRSDAHRKYIFKM